MLDRRQMLKSLAAMTTLCALPEPVQSCDVRSALLHDLREHNAVIVGVILKKPLFSQILRRLPSSQLLLVGISWHRVMKPETMELQCIGRLTFTLTEQTSIYPEMEKSEADELMEAVNLFIREVKEL